MAPGRIASAANQRQTVVSLIAPRPWSPRDGPCASGMNTNGLGPEIYFSIVQRKVLTSPDFASLAALEHHLLVFQARYQTTVMPLR